MLYSNREKKKKGRFSIDAKLVGVLSVIAFLGIVLMVITIIAADTLSSLRSYATVQTHWTEVRKEAVSNLQKYTISGDQLYLKEYDKNIAVLKILENTRVELMSKTADHQKVVSSLKVFDFGEEEVRDMVDTANRFGDLAEFVEALNLWRASDQQVEQLEILAAQIRNRLSESAGSSDKERWTEQIEQIDNRLTDLQYDLASVLNRGSLRLERINLWASVGTGIILLIVGGFMSWRLLRSIHTWEHMLKMNVERYQSLFDQNPNPVYSFTTEGKFVEGNRALESLLGTSLDQIKGINFDQFIHPSERERVRSFFEKAVSGDPQTYETIGIDTDSQKFHVQVTNLPIYVDGEIVGVYGIAQDIEERIQAEQKIQEQLEERTVLLEEIHHRVKNNLAFVSSMLILNEDEIDNEKAKRQLKEAQNRIISIADVHEIFYESEDFSELSVKKYVGQILSRLSDTFDLEEKTIAHNITVDDATLPINKAIPFGLILNELATNSYKHAFNGRKSGSISLDVEAQNEHIQVVYKDNGDGLNSDFQLEDAVQSSLGMQLIYTFIQQLEADYQLAKGTDEFRLRFSFEN